MSWTASGTAVKKPGEPVELDLQRFPQQGDAHDESLAQMEAAELAVHALIDAGHWGEGNFTINLVGHAVPSGSPPKYMSQSISINNVTDPEPANGS